MVKLTEMQIPFIVMGLTSMLLQITALRLLLSTFSGNELDIGITLSFWLIWVGLGSYAGGRVRFRHAFILSFISVALLTVPTLIFIKAIRPALSLEHGEAVSLISTILSTATLLFPLCFAIGLQFPLAVSYSGSYDAAGRVYGLEALGAFIGGILFTFIISGRIGAMELCLLLSLINILMAAYISRKMIIAFLFVMPLSLYIGLHQIVSTLPWQGMEPSQIVESRYGEITVIKVKEQSSIYVNGQLFFTYPDLPNEELRAHLSAALHPSPSRILVIGGSPGTLKEFLKYPVDGIDFIELDPRIVEVSSKLLSMDEDRDAIKELRIRIIVEDGRRFIKRLKRPTYDLIVLNLPPPSTASINRFYTIDFFREAKGVLKEGGILSMTIPQSTGYIGRGMQMAGGSIYNSLKSVFRHVELTTQEYGGLFASEAPIDAGSELEDRFIQRGLNTRHFNQYIFRDAFFRLNVDYVRERLSNIKSINSDLRPSAYLYNLMLWAEIHGGQALNYLLELKGWHIISILVIILISALSLIFRKGRLVLYYSMLTTGFSGISFTLAVALAYQAVYGYVYEMIGMLTATFMLGLWAGTYLTKHTRGPLRTLLYLEITTITLALISPLFFGLETLFYLLTLLSGTITGGQFSTANLCMGEPEKAGRLYGIDLIGSFLGAFISSIVLIPLFGISDTLLFIAGIKTVSVVMLLSLR